MRFSMKYIKQLREHFADFPIFHIRDVKVFLSPYGVSNEYTYLLIHNLTKKGEIQRIARGTYTFRKEGEIVGFAFSPFYYGLQEALTIHKLWEQETNPIVVTPLRVRTGVRTIMGVNALVRHINRRMFFGFDTIKLHDLYLPVSDVEKTLLDFVYFREPLRKDVLDEMKKRINKGVLETYLKRMPLYVQKKVKRIMRLKRTKRI